MPRPTKKTSTKKTAEKKPAKKKVAARKTTGKTTPVTAAKKTATATTVPVAPTPTPTLAKASHPVAVLSKPIPTTDEIRERAVELWIEGGRRSGNENEDWCEAERQLIAERA